MKHNSAEVVEVAKQILKKLEIRYNTLHVQELKPGFTVKQTGLVTDVWVVNYTYTVFEEEDAFVYVNDADLKLIYVLTKHGYITDSHI